jgi:hypothetical protein
MGFSATTSMFPRAPSIGTRYPQRPDQRTPAFLPTHGLRPPGEGVVTDSGCYSMSLYDSESCDDGLCQIEHRVKTSNRDGYIVVVNRPVRRGQDPLSPLGSRLPLLVELNPDTPLGTRPLIGLQERPIYTSIETSIITTLSRADRWAAFCGRRLDRAGACRHVLAGLRRFDPLNESEGSRGVDADSRRYGSVVIRIAP